MTKIRIINRGSQQLPAYATPQSAGMDLRANIEDPITLRPLERRIVPTGLYMEASHDITEHKRLLELLEE